MSDELAGLPAWVKRVNDKLDKIADAAKKIADQRDALIKERESDVRAIRYALARMEYTSDFHAQAAVPFLKNRLVGRDGIGEISET